MSTSAVMRVIAARSVLALAPVTARAQAQTKPCKDGTSSTRSTFACWGHGGVDTTTHAAAKHHAAEPVQAGEPRAKPAKSTKSKAHKPSKAAAHHTKAEHHEAKAA